MEDTFILYCGNDEFIIEPPLHFDTSNCLCIKQRIRNDISGNNLKRARGRDFGLNFELRTRSDALLTSVSTRSLTVHAILGTVCLQRGHYLAVVTKTKEVESLSIEPGKTAVIRKILNVDFLPIPHSGYSKPSDYNFLGTDELKRERLYLNLLQEVVQTKSLYYASNYDLTNSLQRLTEGKSSGTLSPDKRFQWNRTMLLEFEKRALSDWTSSIMCGYIEVKKYLHAAGTRFSYVFISRRGTGRQGTRFIIRGLNQNGNTANFVETEQIILPLSSSGTPDSVAAYAYLQTRGSIPLSWSQKVTMKYMPRVNIDKNEGENTKRFQKHFLHDGEHSIDTYGNIVAVNLVDRVGKSKKIHDQRELGNLFKRECDRLETEIEKHYEKEQRKTIKFVWFDFHHECRKMQWHNLSKLVQEVKSELDSQGCFSILKNGNVGSLQSGVLRTNCMDNLDRTNVVQSLFARQAFLKQLQNEQSSRGQTPDFSIETVMETPFPEFEYVFKNIWGNNADAMSVLYSGTPALKTDFTRTGKRTKVGLLKDGWNSVLRFYLNNFCDGRRQDAVDIFLGKFDASVDKPTRDLLQGESKSFAASTENLLFVYMGLFMIVSILSATFLEEDLFISQKLYVAFWSYIAIAIMLLYLVLKKGRFTSFSRNFVTVPSLVRHI
mmetsp:Transcript_10611/g.12222  ORF Transcript_10611/g.12222 Transcript_10611/m.12222 type:complete len:662 (+) Transcript_10611:200-2185(+)